VINRPPVADAGGPYSGDRGVAIAFDGTGSIDPDGGPLTYNWNFGDGTSGTGPSPSHAYTAGGDYLVILIVRDNDGLQDSDNAAVSVNEITVTQPGGGAVWSEGSTQTIRWTTAGSVPNVVVEFRPNPGALWILVGNAPGEAGQINWQVPDVGDADAPEAVIRVQRTTGAPLFDLSDPFRVQNRVLNVTAPPAGARVFETSTTTIAWTSTGAISAVDLEYRLSPSNAWQPISNNEPNDGSFTWTVAEVTEDKPRVQVRVQDAADPAATQSASGEFTIVNRTIGVTSPESGAIWSEATTQTIEWDFVGPVGDVQLEVQRSPAEAWQPIAVTPASARSYSWLVAPVTADMNQAKVRIREIAPVQDPVVDESATFTIQNRQIAVTAPAAGVEISEHAQTTIAWTSAGAIDNVTIEFRRRPTSVWETVIASTPNDGSFLWSTPNVDNDEPAAQVQVVALGGDLTRGLSQPFTMVNRILVTQIPDPGEILCEADTTTVAWRSRGFIPVVHLEFREQSGAAWTRVVSNLPNTGSYSWSTPDLTATSDQVQLRVIHADDASVQGLWEPFTLLNRTIALIRPTAGQVFSEGDAVPVTWNSSCLDSVRLEARLGPAEPWQLQNLGVYPDVGQIIWTVIRVDEREDAVQVRVSDASDPNRVFAVSQPFTVLNRILDVVRPTVSDSISETQTFTIDWDWIGTLPRVDVDYRLGPALPWIPLLDNAVNEGTLDWTVPLVDQDYREAQVRVTDSNNPSNFDNGDLFIILNRALAFVFPAAGDSVTEVANATIRWNTRGLVPQVNLSYRLNPGDAWQVLAAGVPNSGSYTWTVPEVAADLTAAQVRVEHAGIPDIAAESVPFVIVNRNFAVLSPSQGEQWSETTQQFIRWTTTGQIDSVAIELLLPGQENQLLFPSTPNDGEELWSVPEIDSTLINAQIRVSDVRPPAAGANSAPFTLVNRTITLVAPAPLTRVEWRIGSTQDIRWQTTGVVDAVTIELERVSGGQVEILTASTPNDGSFTWDVTGPETFTAELRVRDVADADVVGATDLPLGLYDLIPPEHCADFDHSTAVSLDEVIRIESIIVGTVPGSEADSLAADCTSCPGTPDVPRIDLCDLLAGVDEMIEAETAGRHRPFEDAGAELGAAEGVVIGIGPAAASTGEFVASMPIEIMSRFPLAGLLVEIEIRGGNAVPALGPDGQDLVLEQVATGSGRWTAMVRRARSDLPAGITVPLVIAIRQPGPGKSAGEITVEVLRAEGVAAKDLRLLPVHLEGARSGVAPLSLGLSQNRPNPFNPATVIPFALPAGGRVRLEVYDVAGRLVRRLVDDPLPAGFHAARWDGRDDRGLTVASGIYIYSLRAGGETLNRKMTLLR
jgi:PKD repeat protein